MNEVQEFILKRAMQKVASKGMQKEANPIKNAWEKGTDWLAEKLLPDSEKQRRSILEPDKPVTLGSDSMRVVGTNSDGSPAWGVNDEPIFDRLVKSPKIKYHNDKQWEARKAIYNLQGKNNPWANLKRKYYEKQQEVHGDKENDLINVLVKNRNLETPYIEFRKQHPEFFEK